MKNEDHPDWNAWVERPDDDAARGIEMIGVARPRILWELEAAAIESHVRSMRVTGIVVPLYAVATVIYVLFDWRWGALIWAGAVLIVSLRLWRSTTYQKRRAQDIRDMLTWTAEDEGNTP